jgi:plastocyanin
MAAENTPARPAPTAAQTAQIAPTPLPEGRHYATPTPAAGILEIKVGDYFFDPPIVTTTVGTTVVWIPVGDLQHTIVAKDPPNAFRTGYTAGLGSPTFDWTFDRPGTIFYHCDYHPGAMDAILFVIDP